jgi:hypothetical protein
LKAEISKVRQLLVYPAVCNEVQSHMNLPSRSVENLVVRLVLDGSTSVEEAGALSSEEV